MNNPFRKDYVLGFAYYGTRVLLIQKTKPDWQSGRLNGVGGKIEEGETPDRAMRREFREETGIDIPETEWECFVTISPAPEMSSGRLTPDHRVWCFVVKYHFALDSEPIKAEEQALWIGSAFVPQDIIIPNLKWLLPLSIAEWRVTGEILERRIP